MASEPSATERDVGTIAETLCRDHLADLGRFEDTTDVGAFEAIVNAYSFAGGAVAFQAGLQRAMRAVGRIAWVDGDSQEHPLGTGFLVAANHVVTSYHVISRRAVAELVIRFDCWDTSPSGDRPLKFGRIISSSPPRAPAAERNDLTDAPNELDYALLELVADTDRPALNMAQKGPVVDETIILLHYPNGAPLKLSAHIVTMATRTRVRYKALTKPGSSGAPCFDSNWDILAVHHFGVPHEFNQGIPFAAIRRHMASVEIPVRMTPAANPPALRNPLNVQEAAASKPKGTRYRDTSALVLPGLLLVGATAVVTLGVLEIVRRNSRAQPADATPSGNAGINGSAALPRLDPSVAAAGSHASARTDSSAAGTPEAGSGSAGTIPSVVRAPVKSATADSPAQLPRIEEISLSQTSLGTQFPPGGTLCRQRGSVMINCTCGAGTTGCVARPPDIRCFAYKGNAGVLGECHASGPACESARKSRQTDRSLSVVSVRCGEM